MTSSELTVRAILVDMDGTVVDSNAVVESNWADIADEFGLDVEEVLKFSHGRPAPATLAHFIPEMPLEERLRRNFLLLADEVEKGHLVKEVPGAGVLLKRLEQLAAPWALVTSATEELARVRFEHSGLPWPEVAVPVERIQHGKPNPEGYLLAASELGIATTDLVIFEDAPAGIQAALRSGASVIVVDGSGPLDVSRLEDDEHLAGQIVAQVPDLESITVEATDDPEVFRITW